MNTKERTLVMISIQGKGVSSGVGVGPLYFYHRTKTEIPRYTVTDPDAEWHRFKGAQTAAIEQLGELAEKARAEAGDVAGALDVIRSYWGGMLDFGATTFWEDFDLEWTRNAYGIDQLPVPGKDDIHGDFGKHCYRGLRHSLCHGWAGGPAAFLTEKVLGIRPAAPGFVQAKIEPCLGGLTRVEGSQPTPFGEIELSVRKIGNKERRLLKLPKEVREV